MQIEKTIALNAPVSAVWDILLDPKRMIECVPGMKSVEVISDDEYRALMQVKISFISASFRLHTKIVERREPEYLRAVGTGEDSAVASSLKQTTELFLREREGGGTTLELKVTVDVVGRIASFGLSAMKTKADRLWEEFGVNLNAQLEAQRPVPTETVPPASIAQSDQPVAQASLTAVPAIQTRPMKIVVVGAGVIGVCTAHALMQDGHEVTLLEAQDGAAKGASHANGGCLSAAFCVPWGSPALPKFVLKSQFDPASPVKIRADFRGSQLRWLWSFLQSCKRDNVVASAQRMQALAAASLTALRQYTKETGIAFDHRQSGILQLYGNTEQRAAMKPYFEALRARGFAAQWLEPSQVFALEPALAANSEHVAGALFVEDEGCGDCEVFTQRLLQFCRDRGLNAQFGVSITSLDVGISASGAKALNSISSDNATWTADAFIFATGVEAASLLGPHVRVPVSAVSGYTMDATITHAESAPRRAVIDHESKLAIAPLGNSVRVAGIAQWGRTSNTLSPDRCKQLATTYERLYPDSADIANARFWLGHRPMTPDGTPIIGETDIAGLFLNVGHGIYGWTMACGSAQLLANVIGRRESTLDPTHYSVLRYAR
jgi:D-amino-acid dehydrogenase